MNDWTILSFGVPEEIANRLVDGRASHPRSRRRRIQHVDRSILRDINVNAATWRSELQAMLDWGIKSHAVTASRLAVVVPRETDPLIVAELGNFLVARRGTKQTRLIRPSEARLEFLQRQLQGLRNRPQLAHAG